MVRAALGALQAPATVLDDARLLATELVSNSIRHADVPAEAHIRVRVTRNETGRLRVDVWDEPNGVSLEELVDFRPPDTSHESGRGLYLVDQIADRWGSADGHHWFELDGPALNGHGG